jgi:hypothetical protein
MEKKSSLKKQTIFTHEQELLPLSVVPPDPSALSPLRISKQRVMEELSDKSRLAGDGNFYQINSEDQRFLTTNTKFYPPLYYDPSQPPRRDLVSDAEQDFRKREYRRQQRNARLQANLDVTRVRLEYDELDKRARELNCLSRKVEDKIRYQTAILIEDMKSFRKMPLQRAGKKQNITQSDKMFGGHQDRFTVGVVQENRDFLTTYSSSFKPDVFTQTV